MPRARNNSAIRNPQSAIPHLVPSLLTWFSQNARDLPWRRTRDPYAIWVSEIMLQQTQVKTVLPYWERWLRALPTIDALARAKPATIHKLWEGLGYYTRVRNLQKAAQEIMSHHGGRFPKDYDAILALPGIGRYTAGAIASIAFNEPRPILDGNVIRVLTRLFGINGNPREKPTNARLWHLAEQLVTAATRHAPRATHQHSHLNQSLMELGALICTPKQPQCPVCPVQHLCVAYRTNRVASLPNLAKRAAATPRHFIAFVLEHRGRYLVRQRPAGVVNARLWEFPNVEVHTPDFDLSKLAATELNLTPSNLQKLRTIKHTITRYRITLDAYRGKLKRSSTKPLADGRWLDQAKLNALAFTAAHRKIMADLTPTIGRTKPLG